MTIDLHTVRRQYLEPILTVLIDSGARVDEIAQHLNKLGTKDRQHNDWHTPAVEAYLVELGFPYYAQAHQPIREESDDDALTTDWQRQH
jgi:hypothetical protein